MPFGSCPCRELGIGFQPVVVVQKERSKQMVTFVIQPPAHNSHLFKWKTASISTFHHSPTQPFDAVVFPPVFDFGTVGSCVDCEPALTSVCCSFASCLQCTWGKLCLCSENFVIWVTTCTLVWVYSPGLGFLWWPALSINCSWPFVFDEIYFVQITFGTPVRAIGLFFRVSSANAKILLEVSTIVRMPKFS